MSESAASAQDAETYRDTLLDVLDICTGWCRAMEAEEALEVIAKIARKGLLRV